MAEKLKNKYIFPDILAKVMSRVDLRTQLEATLMSTTLIVCGLMTTVVYMIFYINLPIWYKIVLGINGIAGFFFMASHLITTFQQYRNVMEVLEFQKEMKGGSIGNA